MYLEPIFASDDIKKDMSKEKGHFDTIDYAWKGTMKKFNDEPVIWETIDGERLKVDLTRDHILLEQI